MSEGVSIAVLGATGLVGREVLAVLDERAFPIRDLRLAASLRSAGAVLECAGRSWRVDPLDSTSFEDVDIAILATPEVVSAAIVSRLAESNAVAIDLSQVFADDYDVPLIVPEINAAEIGGFRQRNLIASPDPVAISLLVALQPLRDAAGIRRVVVTSLEPVAGAGQSGIEVLQRQTIALLRGESDESEVFPHRLAFNLFPQVGEMLQGGSSRGEQTTAAAIRRVLDYPDLPVSVTRVRVPLFFGQAVSVNVETQEPLSADTARELLSAAPGLVVHDEISEGLYPTPADVISQDAVWLGRIRADEEASTVDLWIASDSLRKGAAVNAVQIAEILVREYL